MFPATSLHAVTGRILFIRGVAEIVPAFGRLDVVVDGIDHTSPVGAAGEFFVDHVTSGEHRGRLTFEGDSCAFTFRVPALTALITEIGSIRCTIAEGLEQ